MDKRTTVVEQEPVRLVHDDDDDGPFARAEPIPPQAEPEAPRRAGPAKLGLAAFDKLAAKAFVDADAETLEALYESVRLDAAWLAGDERNASRLRMLSRLLAVEKNNYTLLTALVGERARAGDTRGALDADRLLISSAKRVAALAAAHRLESIGERREAVIAVGVNVAQQVVVETKR